MRGWIYRDIIFSLLTIFGEGVIRSWHIFTRDNIWLGVIISWHHIFTPDHIGAGVIILWHYIFTPHNIWLGGDYIMTLYFHSWQYLVRGWLYCDIMFSLLTIFGEGVIISWHIFTPDNIWWGVIISLHYIIFPDTTLKSGTGGDYIWIFSLSKFDFAVIPGFYYSYPYLGGWSDYI